MNVSRCDLLRWQFGLTWQLFGYHLERLESLDRLTDADLDATAPFPWQNDPEHTVAHMAGWVKFRADEERRRNRPTPAAACGVRGHTVENVAEPVCRVGKETCPGCGRGDMVGAAVLVTAGR